MRTFNKQISTAVDLDADSESVAVPLKNIFMYSIMAIITGTPTGTLKLQGSADPETNDTNPQNNPAPAPTHWADIEDSDQTVSAAGNTIWNVTDVAYNYVRVVYVDGSSGASTAVMTVIFNGKGV